MKILQIVSTAYRATIEEQDDTILWLTQAMKNAGATLDVLLSDDAVNYSIAGQDCSGLVIGEWRQTQPPRIEDDLARMLGKGIDVFAIAEDLAERGLGDAKTVDGVRVVSRAAIARLMNAYDQVWRW
jgi:sulfur relay (sulfurtransferase) DsrF/TusC family protein